MEIRWKSSWANSATNRHNSHKTTFLPGIPSSTTCWHGGIRLDLDQSVTRIQAQYPDWRRDWVEEYLIDWIEMDYAPEHYSTAQFDELDRLTARWIADHLRRAKTTKTQCRTRHS
jgi:hypothetical protein